MVNITCVGLILLAIIVNMASKGRSPQKKHRVVTVITTCAITAYFIHALAVSLVYFDVYPKGKLVCHWIAKINLTVYHLSRFLFFCTLIIHSNVCFVDSIYQYSKRLIALLFIAILGWFS